MNPSHTPDATLLLFASRAGDKEAAAKLLPLVYDDLRKRARTYMKQERPDSTLQPTALVHEAYLRLIDVSRIDWQGRTHFIAMAARQMRRILVEQARRHGAAKRGGRARRVTLSDDLVPSPGRSVDLMALDAALEKLAELSPRQSEVIELRFFGGLTIAETACELSISENKVNHEWRMARAWLLRELTKKPDE